MPGRNIYKEYVDESYYHIYNRGVGKSDIFIDNKDYHAFLNLIKRYLGKETKKRPNGEKYPNYYDQIELLAFCLMSNHFHLFIYQNNTHDIKNFVKSLSVAYGMYFNKRYKRLGPLFQQRYRAVRITNDQQLLHISRYIHMNPDSYINYKWSSLSYYLGINSASWVRPQKVLELFESNNYLQFLDEYKNRKDELAMLKNDLANAFD